MNKTIVQYRGGGYDGCIWEWNYALLDDGEFVNLASSGSKGCNSKEELMKVMNDEHTCLYNIPDDLEDFGEETPVSHLLVVGRELHNEGIEIPVECDSCKQEVSVDYCMGIGEHGVGGIHTDFAEIVCQDCYCSGSCTYCGQFVGVDNVDSEGYCDFCKEDEDE